MNKNEPKNLSHITPEQLRNQYAETIRDDQIELICWLLALSKSKRWSLGDIASAVGRSSTTWSRVLRGKYEGDIAGVLDDLAHYQHLHNERQASGRAAFIETSLSRRIFQTCDAALAMQRIMFIWGDTQIGKTESLIEYQRRNNHGRTIYVRTPASGSYSEFIRRLAKIIGLGASNKTNTAIAERILHNITDRQLLIVDEAHEPLIAGSHHQALKLFEYLREIRDTTGCGLVICGTNVLREGVERGPIARPLTQLRRRGLAGAELQLEDRPLWRDLEQFFEHYQLPDPTGSIKRLIRDLVEQDGLGSLCAWLQQGARLANAKGEDYGWAHFTAARNAIVSNSLPPKN